MKLSTAEIYKAILLLNFASLVESCSINVYGQDFLRFSQCSTTNISDKVQQLNTKIKKFEAKNSTSVELSKIFGKKIDFEIITLTYNGIESLQNDTFIGCENLQNLILTNDRLHAIDRNAFDGLSNLDSLALNDNQLRDLSGRFDPLISLKYLQLSHNKIEIVDKNWFRNNLRLELLKLAHNRISSFGDNTVSHLKIRSIFIFGNSNLTTLNQINSFNINVDKTSIEKFHVNGNVKSLHIRNCRLQLWWECISEFELIKILLLSFNKFSQISCKDVGKLIKLKELALHGNQFKSLDPNMFRNMVKLRSLSVDLLSVYRDLQHVLPNMQILLLHSVFTNDSYAMKELCGLNLEKILLHENNKISRIIYPWDHIVPYFVPGVLANYIPPKKEIKALSKNTRTICMNSEFWWKDF